MTQVTNQGTVVQLAGVRYIMPPISLGAIEREGDAFTELAEGRTPTGKLTFIAKLVTESLRRNYPDIDGDLVANSVDLGNLQELVGALMSTTGLVRAFDDVSPAIS